MIVLLDLNYTLVANSEEKRSPFIRQIEREKYREWLLHLIKDQYVILITARPAKYSEATLKRIERLLDWQPEEAYFNDTGWRPQVFKSYVLRKKIFPRHGRIKDIHYLAIESNPKTRAMYAGYRIPCLMVENQ